MKHLSFGLLLVSIPALACAETSRRTDAGTGWTVHQATQGRTTIRLIPEAGCNVYSIEFAGHELLKQPKSLKDVLGVDNGIPLLYPTPNRIRNSRFTFSGKTYRFSPNDEQNFSHGLVHSVPWELLKVDDGDGKTVFHCRLKFEPGSERFRLFPHRHALELSVTLTDGAVRFTYTVDNSAGDQPVPFGMAYHPWFLYQGSRAETFLTVPATHWMEAVNVLPTGKLIELGGTKFDARMPKSLGGFVIDDVYWGMEPGKPTNIEFRDRKLDIKLFTSPDFTHLVVYTPNEPWFCVENQTCSTDAHNLAAQGLTKESHLQIVDPGKTHTGFAEFRFHQD